ncbi:hypothetical protein CB0940_00643 [Cercospora beticola]|uniref:Uncharacterized protein n=1 Tax=Cercospora beticola TaxID=122368 RepID=A0A2G5I9W6_CERBT|nr:hypothetical protein CB0940_00643 [Cercospora beticola]PIB01550.1 hypothetical protein CB0940_00643 [Cercospora beticola]WPA96068.1 hypothetical protein RHO25_000674 [Cercospora beticola]
MADEISIDRPFGRHWTDSNGVSRYSLPLDVPKGVGMGNEPSISLEYIQSGGNGVLGLGWVLSTYSSVRRIPATVAKGAERPTLDVDRRTEQLALNGQALLNIAGEYHSPGATYTTQIGQDVQVVAAHETEGFVATDRSGRRQIYGATQQAQRTAKVAAATEVREWFLEKSIDVFGNYQTFAYNKNPLPQLGSLEQGVNYLESIRFTSNDKATYSGRWRANFVYQTREDFVVITNGHDQSTSGCLLKRVDFDLLDAGGTKIQTMKSYIFTYTHSASSGVSLLTAVAEIGVDGSSLTPTTFDYGVNYALMKPEQLFVPDKTAAISLPSVDKIAAVLPVNVSGRTLCDLVAVRHDSATGVMSLKTWLATPSTPPPAGSPTINWSETSMSGRSSISKLPYGPRGALSGDNFTMLRADLNGDGRTDIIMPYRTTGDMLSFSLSQSIGTGFKDFVNVYTGKAWQSDCKFLALDCDGNGRVDIVQIYKHSNRIAFRVFWALYDHVTGIATLDAPVETVTTMAWTESKEWLISDIDHNGLQGLIRVYTEKTNRGAELRARAFRISPDPAKRGVFMPTTEEPSTIGQFTHEEARSLTVLTTDINGDGVTDLLICQQINSVDRLHVDFVFRSFLNNGQGAFTERGNAIRQQRTFRSGEQPRNPCRFYATSLDGSRFPSIVCAFQQSYSHDWVCLVASGSSDGQVKELYPSPGASRSSVLIAPAGTLHHSPDQEIDLASVDIDGTGKAGWLLTTNVNGSWSACPVYNASGVPDLLTSTTNPLGLKVDVSYMPMSDQRAYKSARQWHDISMPTDQAVRDVIASQSLVVTRTVSSNEPLINNLPWRQEIVRSYSNAKINLEGRGWQGFEKTTMLDVSSGVLLEEQFHQVWPLSKIKFQTTTIATKTPKLSTQANGDASPDDISALLSSGTIIQRERLDFDVKSLNVNEWDTRRVLQSAKELFQYDNGKPWKISSGMNWTHDDNGNMISEESWESDATLKTRSNQLWKLFSYADIGTAKGMPVRKKITTNVQNKSFDVFEAGDITLTKITYDKAAPFVRETVHWSSDHNKFIGETYEHDAFGNRIKASDAVGLTTNVKYSTDYPNCAVQTTQEAPGLSLTTLSASNAYDMQTSAGRSSTGVLQALTHDAFGRRAQSMVITTDPTDSTITYPTRTNYPTAASADLAQTLSQARLVCQSRTEYKRMKTRSGKNLLTRFVTKYSSADDKSSTTLCEAIDCTGRVRVSRKQSGSFEPVWMYYTFESGGSNLVRSTPWHLPSNIEDGFDWSPPVEKCILSAYDALRRPVLQYRPRSAAAKSATLMQHSYVDGGTKSTSITKYCDEKGVETSDKEIAKTLNTFRNVAGQPQLIGTIDESGLSTSIDYDVVGRITAMTDSSGNVEAREYNATGQLLSINNKYQNTMGSAAGKAVVFTYDERGRLLTTKNVMGETNRLEYDAKGRILQSIGSDLRTTTRTFSSAANGTSTLSRVTISKPSSTDVESQYDFTYDQRARLSSSQISISGTGTYSFSYRYDWQDRLIEKVPPDGSKLQSSYMGDLLAEARIVSADGKTVNVTSSYATYNPQGSVQSSQLSSGAFLSAGSITFNSEHDELNTPMKRSMRGKGDLASMTYTVNEKDQIASITDVLTQEVVAYTYDKQRLAASQHADATFNYAYDASGNITSLGDMQLAYAPSSITGTRNGSTVYEAKFDGAGRLTSRKLGDVEHALTYAGGSRLSQMKDLKAGTITSFLQDPDGNNILCQKPDGSKQITLGQEYRVDIAKDGAETTGVTLLGPEGPVAQLKTQSDGSKHLKAYLLDHKGTVTHSYDCDKATVTKQNFSDYGKSLVRSEENGPGFEGKVQDTDSGLICFGGRWYDPVIGRFITPDTVTDISGLGKRDGLNRYVFENNDPVNHVDPTGHWSWDAIGGIILGAVLIGAAIAVTVATAGVASPLGAALAAGAVGALISAGSTAIFYSIDHMDASNENIDHGKFWKGFFCEVAVSAAVGFITGAAGEFLWGAKGVWNLTQVGARSLSPAASATLTDSLNLAIKTGGEALMSAISNEVNQIADNGIEKSFWDPDKDLTDGLGQAAAQGALSGALTHLGGDFLGGKAAAKKAGNIVWGEVKEAAGKGARKAETTFERLMGKLKFNPVEEEFEMHALRWTIVSSENTVRGMPRMFATIIEDFERSAPALGEIGFVKL